MQMTTSNYITVLTFGALGVFVGAGLTLGMFTALRYFQVF